MAKIIARFWEKKHYKKSLWQNFIEKGKILKKNFMANFK